MILFMQSSETGPTAAPWVERAHTCKEKQEAMAWALGGRGRWLGRPPWGCWVLAMFQLLVEAAVTLEFALK